MVVLGYILLALLVGAAIVLLIASRKPDVFRVERRALIKAPAETIFPHINGLAAWEQWSPWAKKDPAARNVISGAPEGVGSVFEWDGNSQVGKGRMEIIESVPSSRIVIRLNFLKPITCENRTIFTLTPKDGGTEVHWFMEGPALLVSKVMDLFMDMEKLVGRDFEAGLESLRQRVGG